MLRRLVPILAAVTLLTAGCLSIDLGEADVEDALGVTLTASETPLWHAPQDFPHPAFNWPTLTNPPTGGDVADWWKPIPAVDLPDAISGMEHHAAAGADVPTGAGIAVYGSIVVVPSGAGTSIVSIADPANPERLSSFEAGTRGAAIIPYPDGRVVTVLATAGNILVYDITDPTNPKELPSLDSEVGSHKVGVVPGTPIVYNAPSNGGGTGAATPETATGYTDIYDLTNPDDPVRVQEFQNGYGCHHVYFHINADEDKYRAICAGVQMTQIWDITDPRDPEVIVNVPVHHGNPDVPPTSASPAVFSHFSILSNDGNTLIVGDETGGGAAPGCDVYVDSPLGGLSGPVGNLWFYDVSDESNPQLLSWLSPSLPFERLADGTVPNCTAHHGRLIPDNDGRDLLAMAFYTAGVVLVDFTDPSAPFIVDQWNDGANTWEVWYHNGYLITGDISRGLDVLRFT
jgi:hypothetical protein